MTTDTKPLPIFIANEQTWTLKRMRPDRGFSARTLITEPATESDLVAVLAAMTDEARWRVLGPFAAAFPSVFRAKLTDCEDALTSARAEVERLKKALAEADGRARDWETACRRERGDV